MHCTIYVNPFLMLMAVLCVSSRLVSPHYTEPSVSLSHLIMVLVTAIDSPVWPSSRESSTENLSQAGIAEAKDLSPSHVNPLGKATVDDTICLLEAFEHWVAHQPDKPATTWVNEDGSQGRSLTYKVRTLVVTRYEICSSLRRVSLPIHIYYIWVGLILTGT